MQELTIRTADLLNFSEAAKLLGVSRPTLYNRIRKRKLHVVEFAHNRYLLRTEVEWLAREEAAGATPT